MSEPIICFGQQPCGFFPKRFLIAKMQTARRLQQEIGGEIVFFYHDSDHDPRETRTVLRHRKTNEPAMLNFAFANKTERKFAPLYIKKIQSGWQEKTAVTLPNYLPHPLIRLFSGISAGNVADFCLEMYRAMGLLDGITVVRSSSPDLRRQACDVSEFFVDVDYAGTIVRARYLNGDLKLHEGGDLYLPLPEVRFDKTQISPTRDSRLRWMQSVLNCTHYIAGASEQDYLNKEDAPDIKFVVRDTIERADEAFAELIVDDAPDGGSAAGSRAMSVKKDEH